MGQDGEDYESTQPVENALRQATSLTKKSYFSKNWLQREETYQAAVCIYFAEDGRWNATECQVLQPQPVQKAWQRKWMPALDREDNAVCHYIQDGCFKFLYMSTCRMEEPNIDKLHGRRLWPEQTCSLWLFSTNSFTCARERKNAHRKSNFHSNHKYNWWWPRAEIFGIIRSLYCYVVSCGQREMEQLWQVLWSGHHRELLLNLDYWRSNSNVEDKLAMRNGSYSSKRERCNTKSGHNVLSFLAGRSWTPCSYVYTSTVSKYNTKLTLPFPAAKAYLHSSPQSAGDPPHRLPEQVRGVSSWKQPPDEGLSVTPCFLQHPVQRNSNSHPAQCDVN